MINNLVLILISITGVVLAAITDPKFLDFNNDVIAIQLIAHNLNIGDGLSTNSVRDLYQAPPFPVQSISWPPLNIVFAAIGQRVLSEPIYSAFFPNVIAISLFGIISLRLNKTLYFALACCLLVLLPDIRSELARAGSLASFTILLLALILTLWHDSWWKKHSITIAVLSGLLVMTRHEGIVVPLVFSSWYLYKLTKKEIPLKVFVKYILSFFVIISPMLAYNYMESGRFLLSDNVSTATSVYTDHPLQFTYFSQEKIKELSLENNVGKWVNQRYEWLKTNTKFWFSISVFSLILIFYAAVKNIKREALCIGGLIIIGMLVIVSLVPYAPITRYKAPPIAATLFLAILATVNLNIKLKTEKSLQISRLLVLGLLISIPITTITPRFGGINALKDVTVFREKNTKLARLLDDYMRENKRAQIIVMSHRAESISYLYKVKSIYSPRNFGKCDVDLEAFLGKWQVNLIVEKNANKWIMDCVKGNLILQVDDNFVFEVKQ
jgi:hypothetical protein